MKHYIWMEVETTNPSRVVLKLFKQKINVLEVIYLEGAFRFLIDETDRKKLKKIVGYRFVKVRESGIFAWVATLKKKLLIFLGILLFFFFLFFFSHVMVSVQVIHSNKEIRQLVEKALDQYGIRRLTLKKEFHEIEQIKEQILNDYPEQLEWLEIEVSGMKYIVRIEERIITKPEQEKERCHLVATKSAIVKKMIFSLGDAKVAVNDFVKEGDILVSGELLANEEVKGHVCASGNIYGEVWYTTKVSLPMNYETEKKTGKVRWNLEWSNGAVDHLIFRPRLNEYVTEKTSLFSIFGIQFSFLKQHEVIIEENTYTEDEALNQAMKLVDEKFQVKLLENEEIIDKKVLKKTKNNSTMDIEVFVSVIENISRQEEFQEIKEEGFDDDTKSTY